MMRFCDKSVINNVKSLKCRESLMECEVRHASMHWIKVYKRLRFYGFSSGCVKRSILIRYHLRVLISALVLDARRCSRFLATLDSLYIPRR